MKKTMNEQEVEILTRVYLKAYMTALDETRNPDIAVGAAIGVTMVLADKPKKQTGVQPNPLATAIYMMMNQKNNENGGGNKDGEKKDGEIPE